MSRQSIPQIIRDHLPKSIDPSDLVSVSGEIYLHKPTSSKILAKVASGKAVPQLVGETESLRAMARTSTDFVPKLYGHGRVVVEGGNDQACMISEWIDFGGSKGSASTQKELGVKLAKMHTAPQNNDGGGDNTSTSQQRYGFPVPTHCGVTEQDNTWEQDWATFFRERRLGDLVKRIGDAEITDLWTKMLGNAVPRLLNDFQPAPRPVIIHGDLWSGNVATDAKDGRPVIFDPSSYYGHNEVELGVTRMFGGESAAGEGRECFLVRRRMCVD